MMESVVLDIQQPMALYSLLLCIHIGYRVVVIYQISGDFCYLTAKCGLALC
jgi:hypothetical protein